MPSKYRQSAQFWVGRELLIFRLLCQSGKRKLEYCVMVKSGQLKGVTVELDLEGLV